MDGYYNPHLAYQAQFGDPHAASSSGYGHTPPTHLTQNLHRLQTISTDDLRQPLHPSELSAVSATDERIDSPKAARSRPVHGPDHVKHNRTRNGCLTCRKRRVKCDETHPNCQRCLKGSRECEWPDPTAKPKSRKEKHPSPSVEDDPTPPEDGTTEPSQSAPNSPHNARISRNLSVSASDSRLQGRFASQDLSNSSSPPVPATKWSHLPSDVRFYLDHYRKHINAYHYNQKFDTGNFFKHTLIEFAMAYEPLLYGLVAFSAYFHTINTPNGKIHTFLRYYQKSVELLRKSLRTKQRKPEAVLMTILQLASFEEVLGDWVNVVGHQHAAHAIITSHFTPEALVQTEIHRKILTWYIRFDIFAGLMAGTEIKLDRSWQVALTEFYTKQANNDPLDMGAAFEKAMAEGQLFAIDVGTIFGKKAKGLLTFDEFMAEIECLKLQLQRLKEQTACPFALVPPFVQDFPNAPWNRSSDDMIVDATDPTFLLAGDRFVWNLIKLDYWGMELIFLGHMVQLDPSLDKMKILELALQICKMFEALEYANIERDIILATHVSVVVAATAMPAIPKYEMWFRRKFALSESCGYIYPRALRTKMSEYWSTDVNDWWLPDNEGCTDFLRAIRTFHDDRAQDEKTDSRDDLRDMKGLFEAMSLENNRSQSSGASDGPPRVSSKGTDMISNFVEGGMLDDQNLADFGFPALDRDRSSSSDWDGWNFSHDQTGRMT